MSNTTKKNRIRPVHKEDLAFCLNVIRSSFATVAKEFGLTEANCLNYTGFMTLEKLEKQLIEGAIMFGLFEGDRITGFFALSDKGNGIYELKNLCVLPERRHKGYGRLIIDFARNKVRELGGKKITIGIIEENTLLKNWYAENSFAHMGTITLPHLPFTVGFMEMEVL